MRSGQPFHEFGHERLVSTGSWLRFDSIAVSPPGAEFALKPALRIGAFQRIGLTAIDAAQLSAARFLCEHKPHCLAAHRTERRSWLGLRHDARLNRRER